jgi:hypothetical protein
VAIKRSTEYEIPVELPDQRTGAFAIVDLFRARGREVPEPIAEGVSDPDIVAYINHGRWVGECNLHWTEINEDCKNAQLVDPNDARFFCVNCHNEACAGRWRTVVFPAGVATIEASLAALPQSQQNWVPEA